VSAGILASLSELLGAILSAGAALTAAQTHSGLPFDPLVLAVETPPPAPPVEASAPILYWQETRAEPRPLRLHVLRIDLANPALAVTTCIAADPDGDGPAEAALENPLELAAAAHAVVAVNANAFGGLPDAQGRRDSIWTEDKPVEILGWARAPGRDASLPAAAYASLWVNAEGRAAIAHVRPSPPAVAAAAGFSQILRDGRVLGGHGPPLHPRTAAGVDASGRWLWLLVVDGRQSGVSEGMTTLELAEQMKTLGCDDALNLDGGGSTIMLIADEAGRPQIVNRPSGGSPRPLPVMLAIRRR